MARRTLHNLGLAALSLAFGLLLCELALRVYYGAPIHWKFPQERYVADARSGYRLAPLQMAYTHGELLSTNALGLRAGDVTREPPVATRRIVALGDSQTFGLGLRLEDSWPARLEQALDARFAGERWQVLNAGLPASDTCHQEGLLASLLEQLSFEAVVLGFFVNDVACVEAKPQFDLEETQAASRRVLYGLKRSALFTALWQLRPALRNLSQPSTAFLMEMHTIDGTPDPLVEAGWTRVRATLARMQHALAARGIAFTILVIPRRDQVQDAGAGTAYNRRIAEIAAELGVDVVDALPALRDAHARDDSDFFIAWDGHDGSRANAILGEALASAWPPPR